MKKNKNRKMYKVKLKQDDVRKMMEEKLRASTIPSKKRYSRKNKHKGDQS